MKRAAVGLLIAFLAAGCVHGAHLEQVHAGMSRDQVLSIMGQPESSMHTAGRECAVYSVLKDFWSRVPWSMSDRYYVCYSEGKVDYFGRADVPEIR
jgi:SmpA / OmlA family